MQNKALHFKIQVNYYELICNVSSQGKQVWVVSLLTFKYRNQFCVPSWTVLQRGILCVRPVEGGVLVEYFCALL
jgi:hypothetical protein